MVCSSKLGQRVLKQCKPPWIIPKVMYLGVGLHDYKALYSSYALAVATSAAMS